MEDNFKQLVALTVLNEMFRKGWFSICCIDEVAKLLNVHPDGEAYNVLRPLHCMDFNRMPDVLRKAIPGMIKQCLNVDTIFRFETMEPNVIDVMVNETLQGKSFFKRLLPAKEK